MNRKLNKCCIIVALVVFSLSACSVNDYYTEINDITEYGVITGLNKRAEVQAKNDFERYFPREIAPAFEEVRYSYRALSIDSISYEIYLEFVIPDPDEFKAYVSPIFSKDNLESFSFDKQFIEYRPEKNIFHISKELYENNPSVKGEKYYRIDSAIIEKTLINPEERRIIIVALRVSDGGATRTSELNCFFNRFHIDPVEFSKTLYAYSES